MSFFVIVAIAKDPSPRTWAQRIVQTLTASEASIAVASALAGIGFDFDPPHDAHDTHITQTNRPPIS
ncbi:MAG: hypothetical protein AABZ53_05915 [Planctomycetota bacterium]